MSLRLRTDVIDPRLASGPHETDADTIAQYASAMKQGDQFPPIRAVDYGDSFMIVDGHHRTAAARMAGLPVSALIADGEQFEDLDNSLRADGDGKRADDVEFWT